MLDNKNFLALKTFSNGICGEVYSINVIFIEKGKEVDSFFANCHPSGEIDKFIELSMSLPEKTTHKNYNSMLNDFSRFYKDSKVSRIISHLSFPSESILFIDMLKKGFITKSEIPLSIFDLSAIPWIGISLQEYCRQNDIEFNQNDNSVSGITKLIAKSYINMLADKNYENDYITMNEATKMFKVSPYTLDKILNKKVPGRYFSSIEAKKFGKFWLISKKSLRYFFRERKCKNEIDK